MRFKPTWQQCQLLQAVQDATYNNGPRRIAVKSGQGPGKSKSAAVAMLWRTLQSVDCLTLVTAPTMRQCRDIPLTESALMLEKADPILRKIISVTKSKVEIMNRPTWGVKLVTATKSENFSGYHNQGLTVIGEEAAGIDRDIITTVKGTLTNADSLFLLVGNPNNRDCAFFDCFNSQRRLWSTFSWNAEDTARDYPWLLDPRRNELIAEEFGRESDVYRIRVLGEFPHQDPNCVISSEDLEKVSGAGLMLAASRIERPVDCGGGLARQFGIDLSRYGGDESTIFRRSGNAIVEWRPFVHTDPSDVLDVAFEMQMRAAWADDQAMYVCDAGGMGQGIMHRFYHAGKNIVEFHNGGRSMDSMTYDNRITEAWFRFAKLVKAGRCMIPQDIQLHQQLSGRRYYTTKKGKLVLETKDDYMKRGYTSPDRADGCVYAFDDNVHMVGNISGKESGGRSSNIGVRVT